MPTTAPAPLSEQDAAAAVARIVRRQRRQARQLVGVAAFNSGPPLVAVAPRTAA